MIIKDCVSWGNPRFAKYGKVPDWPTNDDINFTKIDRMQIATLRK
jgi:hypothetical protein